MKGGASHIFLSIAGGESPSPPSHSHSHGEEECHSHDHEAKAHESCEQTSGVKGYLCKIKLNWTFVNNE